MIWLQIFAVMLAQAIMVTLFITYIDRKQHSSATDTTTPDTSGEEELEKPVTDNAEEDKGKKQSSGDVQDLTSAVGVSSFDYDKFTQMVKEVMTPIVKECIETAMEAKECEFIADSKKESGDVNPMRMTKEQERAAFEDYRRAEERLQREDNSLASPNPLAGGASFEEIATATVYLDSSKELNATQHKLIVKVFSDVKGTQLEDIMPDKLRERMYACHRDASKSPEAFKNKDAEMDAEEANEARIDSQESATPDYSNAPTSDPNVSDSQIEEAPATDALDTEENNRKSAKEEDAKPRRNFVPLNSFANPNNPN